MKEKIIVFGAGVIAQLAKYYFDIDSNYEVVAFVVDREYIKEKTFEGLPVVAFEDAATVYPPAQYKMFVGLSYTGLNKYREARFYDAKKKGYQLVSYLSSHCTYLSQFLPGENCFILEDNTIQPYVKIGDNVMLWSGNHIGHHSEIRSHNFVSSHVVISGHCIIEENCFLGVNSTLHNGVRIARETILAAGSLVSKQTHQGDVVLPPRSTVAGKKSSEIEL